ncbi:MAG: SAF domain-containing protein [Steroidobacteraceae bacterium]
MKWSFRPSPSLLLAAFALAAAGFAYWASQRYLEQNANSVRQRWERRYAAVPTLVSKRELPAGHVLLADDLAVRSMPAAYLPRRSLGVRDADGAVGRRLIVALHAGDPLTQALLESRSVVTPRISCSRARAPSPYRSTRSARRAGSCGRAIAST